MSHAKSYAERLLPEFDREMPKTRRVLERVPEDKMDWLPHAKSNTIGWNANHMAEIPSWVHGTLTTESWDLAPPGEEPYQSPSFTTVREILEMFDRNVAEARKAIEATSDEAVAKEWSLMIGGNPVLTMTREAVIRDFVMNHLAHHRAILCVYFRLNDIPVPAIYGPSGDEEG